MSNLLFDEAPATSPQWQEPPGAFSVDGADRATLGATGTMPPLRADQALCLPLSLVAGPQLRTEVQASVIVRNGPGQIVGQTSAIFATDDQRSGRQSRPGDVLSAWPLLRLPYGAMPGEYEIWLRVFDDASAGDGHEWRDASGAPWGANCRWASGGSSRALTGKRRDATRICQSGRTGPERRPAFAGPQLGGGTLRPGQTLDLHLLWRADEGLPQLTLRTADGNWSRELAPCPGRGTASRWTGARRPCRRSWRPAKSSCKSATGRNWRAGKLSNCHGCWRRRTSPSPSISPSATRPR